jgi:hypothetical protein
LKKSTPAHYPGIKPKNPGSATGMRESFTSSGDKNDKIDGNADYVKSKT